METEQVVKLLDEAVELLRDASSKFAMFENQRYCKLLTKVNHFKAISGKLHTALDKIDTQ